MIARKLILSIFMCITMLSAQSSTSTNEYLLGTEEKLEMIVHVWGEVRSPGEYRVAYNTNIVEVLSIAGGPTETANLRSVRLTRAAHLDSTLSQLMQREIINFNIKAYLTDADESIMPPVLQPGDVVYVKNNSFHWTREMIRVMYEIALVASVVAWHLRK